MTDPTPTPAAREPGDTRRLFCGCGRDRTFTLGDPARPVCDGCGRPQRYAWEEPGVNERAGTCGCDMTFKARIANALESIASTLASSGGR